MRHGSVAGPAQTPIEGGGDRPITTLVQGLTSEELNRTYLLAWLVGGLLGVLLGGGILVALLS